VEAIVAADAHWGIGNNARLLCPIRADLRRFRQLTWGRTVILGRKTLSTFPGGRPLPGRTNLILSRRPGFSVDGAAVFSCLEDLLAAAPDDSIVIGGESVYNQLLDFCRFVYVTKILRTFPADAFFPNLDADPAWEPARTQPPLEENGVRFQYAAYRRKE